MSSGSLPVRLGRWVVLALCVISSVGLGQTRTANAQIAPPAPAPPIAPPVAPVLPSEPGADECGLGPAVPCPADFEEQTAWEQWAWCYLTPAGLFDPRCDEVGAEEPSPEPPTEGEGNPGGDVEVEIPGGPDLTDYQTAATANGWEWVGGAIPYAGGTELDLVGSEAWEDLSVTYDAGAHVWRSDVAFVFIPNEDGPTGQSCTVVSDGEGRVRVKSAYCASGSNVPLQPVIDGVSFGGVGSAATLNVSRPHFVYASFAAIRKPDSWYGGESHGWGCFTIDTGGCVSNYDIETRNAWSNLREWVDYIRPGVTFGGEGMPSGTIYGLVHSKPGTYRSPVPLWSPLVTPPEVEPSTTEVLPQVLPEVEVPDATEVPVPTVTEPEAPPVVTMAPPPEQDPEVAPSTTTDVALGDRLVETLSGLGEFIVGGILWLGDVLWQIARWMVEQLTVLLALLFNTLWAMLRVLLLFIGEWLSLILQWMVSMLGAVLAFLQQIIGLLGVMLSTLSGQLSGVLAYLSLLINLQSLLAWMGSLLELLLTIPEQIMRLVPETVYGLVVPTMTPEQFVEAATPPGHCLFVMQCSPAPSPETPGGVPGSPPFAPALPSTVTASCGPTIYLPAPLDWTVYVPTPPESGCPGNGPGGARTAFDNGAGGFFGLRAGIRGLATVLLWFTFVLMLMRSLPWIGRDYPHIVNLSTMWGDRNDARAG